MSDKKKIWLAIWDLVHNLWYSNKINADIFDALVLGLRKTQKKFKIKL